MYEGNRTPEEIEDEVRTVRKATCPPTIPNSYGVITRLLGLNVAYTRMLQEGVVNG